MGGNTSIGVTKYYNGTAPYNSPDVADLYLDISKVPEFNSYSYDVATETLSVGAGGPIK